MGQGPSGPTGSTGSRGDIGPQGPPGAPGKDASGDPNQVSSLLSADASFHSRLAPLVAKDNAIGIAVAEKVASEQVPRQLVTNALLTNKSFSDKLIDSMAIDTRFRGVQGPPGSAFDEISIQSALQPKSMWCADGQMCRIPTSAPGTYLTGDTVIQRSKYLYLGGATNSSSGGLLVDNKHGIVVKDTNPKDGPFIYGVTGGNLGTFDQVNSTSPSATLTWDADNVNVKKNLFIGGNVIQSASDFKLGYKNVDRGDSGESRALVKDNDNTLKINYEGDFAGGTTVDGQHLNIPSGTLKLKDWTISQDAFGNLVFNTTKQDAGIQLPGGWTAKTGADYILQKHDTTNNTPRKADNGQEIHLKINGGGNADAGFGSSLFVGNDLGVKNTINVDKTISAKEDIVAGRNLSAKGSVLAGDEIHVGNKNGKNWKMYVGGDNTENSLLFATFNNPSGAEKGTDLGWRDSNFTMGRNGNFTANNSISLKNEIAFGGGKHAWVIAKQGDRLNIMRNDGGDGHNANWNTKHSHQ